MDLTNTKFDIVIQGGQSNAEGLGTGSVKKELLPSMSENIFYLDSEKEVEHLKDCVRITFANTPFLINPAKERVSEQNPIGDFSLAFASMYEKEIIQNRDRKLLIVRAAVGGTGFIKGHWGLGNQLYLKMLEMTDFALSLNKENRVVGFLWHQGECDASEKNEPDVFKQQLSDMVHDVRARYGEKLPFIAGDFVSEWKNKNIADCTPIVEMIRQVVVEAGDAAFVETSDLLSNNQKICNGDDIHFCREALYILGQRYFSVFKEICQND